MAKGEEWTKDEYIQSIASYFGMLERELAGQKYVKSEFRRELETQITRSPGSIEYRYQNISSALMELGYPSIRGYKPASNYDLVLEDYIQEYLESHPLKEQTIVDSAALPSKEPRPELALEVLGPVPECDFTKSSKERNAARRRRARKTDYAAREEQNRTLGKKGEGLVFEFEKKRLIEAGRSDLAEKVKWVSEEQGDGLSYDILSWEVTDEERYIEVKTTRGGKFQPFLISSSELQFSKEMEDNYYLYRVYNADEQPEVFAMKGSLATWFEQKRVVLEATEYRASF